MRSTYQSLFRENGMKTVYLEIGNEYNYHLSIKKAIYFVTYFLYEKENKFYFLKDILDNKNVNSTILIYDT